MTLVSIVGDFHSCVLPMFYHMRHKLDSHVIIYDDFRQDVVQAKKIINGTGAFIEKYNLPINSHKMQIDEDSVASIANIVSELLKLEDDATQIYINATDGLANISLLLFHALFKYGVCFVVYDRYDNSYNLLQNETMKKVIIEESIPILDHFLLRDIHTHPTQDAEVAKGFEQELLDLFELFGGDKKAYLEVFPKTELFKQSSQIGLLFEMYVYNLLKDLSHDDISIGIKAHDIYSSATALENEFDILIMKRNNLHMIECKFQEEIDKTNLIYKADSVRTLIDDESKIIILSNEAVYDKQQDIQSPFTKGEFKRANAKKIYFRGSPMQNVDRFVKEVDKIFALKTPNIDEILAQRKKASSLLLYKTNQGVLNLSKLTRLYPAVVVDLQGEIAQMSLEWVDMYADKVKVLSYVLVFDFTPQGSEVKDKVNLDFATKEELLSKMQEVALLFHD
jgi:hypothetical protein